MQVSLRNSSSGTWLTIIRRVRSIGVTFRGSVTPRDFIVDADPFQLCVKDPTLGKETRHKIGIHHGFYNYLFHEVKMEDGLKATKYQNILNELKEAVQRHPDFKVEVRGHSLGGALSMLFTLYAANEDWMPRIYCFTFAAPRIGNIEFCRAFRRLEDHGRVLNLRIVNEMDPVPLMPDRLNFCTAIFTKIAFRHAGIELLLRRKDSHRYHGKRFYDNVVIQILVDYSIVLAKFFVTIFGCLGCLLCWWSPALKETIRMHSCDEYMERLERESQYLETISLSDVYEEVYGKEATEEMENAAIARKDSL